MNIDHVRRIRDRYVFLLENIDPKYSGIVAELFSMHVIDVAEKESLEAEPSITRRNEVLLSIVSRKTSEIFQVFLVALYKTNQSHVAKALGDDGGGNAAVEGQVAVADDARQVDEMQDDVVPDIDGDEDVNEELKQMRKTIAQLTDKVEGTVGLTYIKQK